uniref:UV-endonuclease UvdE n=1 Tax=Moniliophthora roreri TaxID=221103 RepID=A0A0W0EZA6_MONRR
MSRRSTRLINAKTIATDSAVATQTAQHVEITSNKRKRATFAQKGVVVSHNIEKNIDEDSDLTSLDEFVDEVKSPKKKAKRSPRKKKGTEDATTYDDVSPKKPRKPRVPKPEPVYIIPDVEKKATRFRGRLGYACLNTVLRNKKPASESVFCSRTCRIDSIKKNGMDWVRELGRKNVQDLLTMIQWNEDNKIRLMRVSSEMFPFASHAVYGYSLDYCAPLLAEAGKLARKYGHRLTVHPGQFTQLGSPKTHVVDAAVRELKYHCEMLDLMGVGKDGVIVIHGGGVYEDKTATLERIKTTITNLLPQPVRDRLVLENDELCYNAEDLLPLCEELSVPLIFDYHHDTLKPSSISPTEIIKRTNAIFHRRGITPKQHLSEPRPGAVTIMERRAHADRCTALPAELELDDVARDVDLMIEAKDKEQAVLELYRMYGLEDVKHESLRPPAENQTKETKGRKSNKRKKKVAGEENMDEDEDSVALDLADPGDVQVVEDEDRDHGAIAPEPKGGDNMAEESRPETRGRGARP